MNELETRIRHWYENIASMTPDNIEARRDVELAISYLDDGVLRVAEINEANEVVAVIQRLARDARHGGVEGAHRGLVRVLRKAAETQRKRRGRESSGALMQQRKRRRRTRRGCPRSRPLRPSPPGHRSPVVSAQAQRTSLPVFVRGCNQQQRTQQPPHTQ